MIQGTYFGEQAVALVPQHALRELLCGEQPHTDPPVELPVSCKAKVFIDDDNGAGYAHCKNVILTTTDVAPGDTVTRKLGEHISATCLSICQNRC